jgi:predicted metalloprotease
MSFTLLSMLGSSAVSARPLLQDDETSQTGVEGNSYTSPSFGYSITWDNDWAVSDELNEDEYNKLVLTNDVASVYFEGVADTADIETCLDTVASSLENEDGVSNVEIAEDSDGPIGGTEENRAWAIYTLSYTTEEGEEFEFAEYIDCRAVTPGEALLVITMLVSIDDLESQIDPLASLLEGLSLEGDTGSTGGDDGDTGNIPASGDLAAFVLTSGNDINGFWEREFKLISNGVEYEPPAEIIPFDDSVTTDCGAVSIGEVGPFYCPPDSTIYYDLAFGEFQIEQFGSESVIAVTMAHEWGHHIQNLMQWAECTQTPCLDPAEMTSQEFELQADCFAGAWVADAETRGRLGSTDVETNITQFAALFGDEGVGNTADPGAHGKGARRVYEFLTGYYEGITECLKISAATDPDRNGANAQPTAEATEEVTPEPTEEATEEPTAEPTEEVTEEPTEEPTEEATEAPTEEPTDEPTAEANTGGQFEMGDEFEVVVRRATLLITITSTETAGSLPVSGFTADGKYLAVYFSLDREASSPGPFPFEEFTVVDSDGNEYEFDEAATDALLKTSDVFPNGVEEDIEEGSTYNLAIVFDVPAGASGFTLLADGGDIEVTLDS